MEDDDLEVRGISGTKADLKIRPLKPLL